MLRLHPLPPLILGLVLVLVVILFQLLLRSLVIVLFRVLAALCSGARSLEPLIRMSIWGQQQGGWTPVEKVSFAREVEMIPLHTGNSKHKSTAVATVPQPRGTEDADEGKKTTFRR